MTRAALLRFTLRACVAGALLFVAFRLAIPEGGASLAESLASAWKGSPTLALACFALAFVIFGISFAIGALRFQILLAGAQLDPGFGPLMRAYVVAGFFNLVLPGAMLGDVYRLFDVRRKMGSGSELLGLVVLERLLSLAALGSIGLIVAPFIPLTQGDRGLAWGLLGLCALFMGMTVALLQPKVNGLVLRTLHPLSRLSSTLMARIERSLGALRGLSARPALIARAFFLSVLNQWLPVGAVFVLAIPLDSSVAWYWIAIMVPFITFASLLPISIGGTGVREYLFVTLFAAVGMRAEVALTLSLSVLAVAIVWAIAGFALFAVGRREHAEARA